MKSKKNTLRKLGVSGFLSVIAVVFSASVVVAAEVDLQWDAPTTNADGSPLNDLAGYKVYFGNASGNYMSTVDVGGTTTYTVLGLNPSQSWFFAVTAYDDSLNESVFSNEVNQIFNGPPLDPNDVDGDGIPNNIDTDDDNDGLTDAQENALGTNPLAADTDQDGVNDGQEVTDGSNPFDRGSSVQTIGRTFCAEWNGFLGGMWNYLEHHNRSNSAVKVDTTIFDFSGNPVSSASFNLAAGEQRDIPVHTLNGWQTDLYGKVCSHHDGNAGDVDGRMSYYKETSPNSGSFYFAFSMPATNGKTGRQYVPFNTINPGDLSHLAANWIQITSLVSNVETGRLRFYDTAGNHLATQLVSVGGPGNPPRSDYSAHDIAGRSVVGHVEWVPDNSLVPFIIRNVRYLYNNATGSPATFYTAFQLEGSYPSGERLSMPLSTIGGFTVLEITNTTSSTLTANVNIYGGLSNGSTIPVTLEPRASFHLISNDLLGANQTGLAVVDGPSSNTVIATAMHYTFGPSGLDYMYGLPGDPALGDVLLGSANTFLGQSSWLVLANPTSNNTSVTIAGLNQGVPVSVPARSSVSVLLNNYMSADSYGPFTTTQDRPNELTSWVLRVRGGDYVIPTPVRQ